MAGEVPCSLQVIFAWVTGGNAEKSEELKLKEPSVLESVAINIVKPIFIIFLTCIRGKATQHIQESPGVSWTECKYTLLLSAHSTRPEFITHKTTDKVDKRFAPTHSESFRAKAQFRAWHRDFLQKDLCNSPKLQLCRVKGLLIRSVL